MQAPAPNHTSVPIPLSSPGAGPSTPDPDADDHTNTSTTHDDMPGVPLRTQYAAQRKRTTTHGAHASGKGHTPVPLILESFPAPPSFIPASPAPQPRALPYTTPPAAYVALHALATSPPPREPRERDVLSSSLGGQPYTPTLAASNTTPFLSRSLNSPPVTPRTPAGTKATHHTHMNPPPSAPPMAPLPPVPGPSSISADESAQLLASSRRNSRASIMSATLPRTSFSSNHAYATGDEGRSKRHSGSNQVDEDGRRIRSGRGSKRNSVETVASLSLSQSLSGLDRDREREREPHTQTSHTTHSTHTHTHAHRAQTPTAYAPITEEDAPDFANFSSVGSTVGRAMAVAKTLPFRARNTKGLAGLDFGDDEKRGGGDRERERERGDRDRRDGFGGGDGAGDESLASIDMRDMPPASPETSPILSRAIANAHAMVLPKGGVPMGNITNAGREGSGSGHTPTQQVFPSTEAHSTSNSNSVSSPDEAQQLHLRMRAARSKSESHKRALALRSPPPEPASARSESFSARGASPSGSGSGNGATPRARTPSGSIPRARTPSGSIPRAITPSGARTTSTIGKPGVKPPPTPTRTNSTPVLAPRARSTSPDIAHILAATPKAKPRNSGSARLSAASAGTVSTQRSSGSGSAGSYGTPLDAHYVPPTLSEVTAGAGAGSGGGEGRRPAGVRRYASEGAGRKGELAHLGGGEPDEFGVLGPGAITRRGESGGSSASVGVLGGIVAVGGVGGVGGIGGVGTKRVSWDDAFSHSAPQQRRSRGSAGLGSGGIKEEMESVWAATATDGDVGGSDSDSSLDLHTPLPHLMLRHGLLSPHSKLLPEAARPRAASASAGVRASAMSSDSSMTKSGLFKDSRDTPQRRVRHRDGKQLRAGMGLTTGLGWSDSEDEDAPSPLTRRLSTLNLSRSASAASLRSNHPLSRAQSHNTLYEESEPASPRRARAPPSSWAKLHVNSMSSNPDTPTSSSSTTSLPLPITPDDPPGHGPDTEKGLPPLPPPTPTSVRAMKRYPSNLTLRTPSRASERERTLSGASSVSMNSTSAINGHYPLQMPPTPNPPLPSGLAFSSSQSTPNASISSSNAPPSFKLAHPPRPLRLSQSINLRVAAAGGALQVQVPAVPSPTAGQPGQGQGVLGYNRNVMDAQRAHARGRVASASAPTTPATPTDPTLKPMPRTGTGMVYRTSSSSRMRMPAPPRALGTTQSLYVASTGPGRAVAL